MTRPKWIGKLDEPIRGLVDAMRGYPVKTIESCAGRAAGGNAHPNNPHAAGDPTWSSAAWIAFYVEPTRRGRPSFFEALEAFAQPGVVRWREHHRDLVRLRRGEPLAEVTVFSLEIGGGAQVIDDLERHLRTFARRR